MSDKPARLSASTPAYKGESILEAVRHGVAILTDVSRVAKPSEVGIMKNITGWLEAI